MKKILTCTDGSIYAQSIYSHTAWAANRWNASVHLLHMLEPQHKAAGSVDFTGAIGPDTGEELLQQLVALEEEKSRLARERGKRLLEAAQAALQAKGVKTITTEQQHGELVESVTKIEQNSDLVIMGKRGEHADFASLHLGSNLERVIRASFRPVLVASRHFTPIERFLIAYDGGPSIEKALQFAQEQPILKGVSCHLVRAGKIDAKAEKSLGEAAEKLKSAGYSVTVRVISGHPEKAIEQTVKDQDIQLLVMGAYGHSRIRNLIVGSTTTEMVRTCQIPVMLFR